MRLRRVPPRYDLVGVGERVQLSPGLAEKPLDLAIGLQVEGAGEHVAYLLPHEQLLERRGAFPWLAGAELGAVVDPDRRWLAVPGDRPARHAHHVGRCGVGEHAVSYNESRRVVSVRNELLAVGQQRPARVPQQVGVPSLVPRPRDAPCAPARPIHHAVLHQDPACCVIRGATGQGFPGWS